MEQVNEILAGYEDNMMKNKLMLSLCVCQKKCIKVT
jgi:hypothetical protein